MKNLLFSALFFLPFLFAFSAPEKPDTTCPEPVNVHVTAKTSGSITFDWDDFDGGNNSFRVKYLRQSDGYNSQEFFTGISGYTFSGLQPGTYTFYFKMDCGGEVSGIIGIEDMVIG